MTPDTLAAIVAREPEVQRLRTLALSVEDGGWHNADYLRAFVDGDDEQVFPDEDAAFVEAATPATVVALTDDRRTLLALLRDTRDALDAVLSDEPVLDPTPPSAMWRWYSEGWNRCARDVRAALDPEPPA